MASLSTGDNAVGSYYHVAVKVHIHFQSGQDHEIQLVYHSALVKGICVLACGNTEVL